MAKRLRVVYLGNSHYLAMQSVKQGTEFKAVEYRDEDGVFIGAMIRGSTLAKASKTKGIFVAKQYLFAIGNYATLNEMEIIK
jgi:hypothetical protein